MLAVKRSFDYGKCLWHLKCCLGHVKCAMRNSVDAVVVAAAASNRAHSYFHLGHRCDSAALPVRNRDSATVVSNVLFRSTKMHLCHQ